MTMRGIRYGSTRGGTNRRRFLKGAGTGAALGVAGLWPAGVAQAGPGYPTDCSPPLSPTPPQPFKPNPSLPMRVRKSVFELTKPEIDRLKDAYRALRTLTATNPEDPRGWLRQGNVHCWYCGGGTDGAHGPSVHGSWWFQPWHRGFLYFHERILAKLIGDDTFALPYWDWDSQGRQTFPTAYGDPNDTSNPLYDFYRSAKPGSMIPSNVVSKRIMETTMSQPTSDLYLGSQGGTAGAMENQPHGPVHVWTGDTSMRNSKVDMGVLATAAQDPVFFAHHDNIDRLWDVWLSLSPSHTNFTSPDWLNHSWTFYDENAVWTSITVADVINHETSLRYRFQPPSVPPIWIYTRRRIPVAAAGASGSALAAAVASTRSLAVATSERGSRLGVRPVSQSVSVPTGNRALFSRLAQATRRVTAGADDRPAAPPLVLHIDGIEVPPSEHALFNVFLNLPDATAATGTEVPNFIGSVSVVAKTGPGGTHSHTSVNAAFDVTDALAELAGDAGRLTVTLVPFVADGQTPDSHSVIYKRIYIASE